MTGNENQARAIGVICGDLAGCHREDYELNMRGLARRIGVELDEPFVELDAENLKPLLTLYEEHHRTGATVVITPSLRHMFGVAPYVTDWADIYTVGRGRIYRRGHRWSANDVDDTP